MKGTKEDMEATYDSIAPFFSRNRQDPWPPTDGFLKEIAPCRLLDIGCGTGRVTAAGLALKCDVVGMDISQGQLEAARRTLADAGYSSGYQLMKGDMKELPFEEGSFDAVCMIASIHHLPTPEERKKAIREASRVLKEEGRIQISVWSWDQERFRDRHLSRMTGERPPDDHDGTFPGDFLVPWKDGVERMRFYHLFGPGELEDLVEGTDMAVERSFFDGRNHWLEACRK